MGEMADLWDKFFGGKFTKNININRHIIYEEQLKLLLLEAHDWIDELNNSSPAESGEALVCYVCHQTGYDAQGLKHSEGCILIRIRDVIYA